MICPICNENEVPSGTDEKFCADCRPKAAMRVLNMGLAHRFGSKPNVAGSGISGHAAAHSTTRSNLDRDDFSLPPPDGKGR